MKALKRILAQLPLYLVYILLSSILVAWVFGIASDTSREKKIVLYADAPAMRQTELSLKLEEELPEGITMIRAHPFRYALFDSGKIGQADIVIIPESRIDELREGLLEIPGDDPAARFYKGREGIKVYDAASGAGILTDYVVYGEEDCYLFFGALSLHVGSERSVDGAAFEVADRLLSMRSETV